MEERFHVGQKVRCIDDQIHHELQAPSYLGTGLGELKAGEIYTIRWEGMVQHPERKLMYYVLLEEIRRHVDAGTGKEAVYFAFRFESIPDTDISIFDKFKNPSQAEIDHYMKELEEWKREAEEYERESEDA